MYKCVVVDLDGTLLNSYGQVTEETKKVIKDTMKKGTEIVIASGRTIDSIKNIAEEIGCNKYFIAGNGAVIYDIVEDKIIYEKYLEKEKVLEIIKLCEENSISYNVYTDTTIIAKEYKHNVLFYHKENLKKAEAKQTKITLAENIEEYVRGLQESKFIKITVCDETTIIFNSIIRKLRKITGIEVLDVLHMSRKTIKQGTEDILIEYNYTEISKANADKWSAIEHLLPLLKVKQEEVIAIGDNINDKTMIRNAGLGIVMEGSTPVVTELADYITSKNDEEGVARAIQKFVI